MKNLNSGGNKSGKYRLRKSMACEVCGEMADGLFKTKFYEQTQLCATHAKEHYMLEGKIEVWKIKKTNNKK